MLAELLSHLERQKPMCSYAVVKDARVGRVSFRLDLRYPSNGKVSVLLRHLQHGLYRGRPVPSDVLILIRHLRAVKFSISALTLSYPGAMCPSDQHAFL